MAWGSESCSAPVVNLLIRNHSVSFALHGLPGDPESFRPDANNYPLFCDFPALSTFCVPEIFFLFLISSKHYFQGTKVECVNSVKLVEIIV